MSQLPPFYNNFIHSPLGPIGIALHTEGLSSSTGVRSNQTFSTRSTAIRISSRRGALDGSTPGIASRSATNYW